MKIVKIDCSLISDWRSFHLVFKNTFGFPEYYGENMDAWIDCMTYLDENFPEAQIEKGTTLTLQLNKIQSFRQRCPEIYEAIVECTAFVNYRRIEIGENPTLLLAYSK
jgi:RNAse (barnase) inhibitor barstar